MLIQMKLCRFIKRWDKEGQVAHLDGFWRASVEEREGSKSFQKHLERMTTCHCHQEV